MGRNNNQGGIRTHTNISFSANGNNSHFTINGSGNLHNVFSNNNGRFEVSVDEEWSDEDSSDYSEDRFSSDSDYDEEQEEDEHQQEDEEGETIYITEVKRNLKSIPDTCVICTETFNRTSTSAGYLHCQHWFHMECIKKWLVVKNKCPHCMTKVNELFHNCK
jgi:Ring finger domain